MTGAITTLGAGPDCTLSRESRSTTNRCSLLLSDFKENSLAVTGTFKSTTTLRSVLPFIPVRIPANKGCSLGGGFNVPFNWAFSISITKREGSFITKTRCLGDADTSKTIRFCFSVVINSNDFTLICCATHRVDTNCNPKKNKIFPYLPITIP